MSRSRDETLYNVDGVAETFLKSRFESGSMDRRALASLPSICHNITSRAVHSQRVESVALLQGRVQARRVAPAGLSSYSTYHKRRTLHAPRSDSLFVTGTKTNAPLAFLQRRDGTFQATDSTTPRGSTTFTRRDTPTSSTITTSRTTAPYTSLRRFRRRP